MIEWAPVAGSTRIIAEAYDPETETIYVRFPDGVEWWYGACPPHVWEQFRLPGQSRGQYIRSVLDFKPNGRYSG
jgi:KTSC domain